MAITNGQFLHHLSDKVLDAFIGDLPPIEKVFHCDFSDEPSRAGRTIGIRRPAVPNSHRPGFDGEPDNPLLPNEHDPYEYEEAFDVILGKITNGSGSTPLTDTLNPNYELWVDELPIDNFGGIDRFVGDITPTIYRTFNEHIYRAYTQDVAHGTGELNPLIVVKNGSVGRYHPDTYTFGHDQLSELAHSMYDTPGIYGASDFGSYLNEWSNITDHTCLLHPWLYFSMFRNDRYDIFHRPEMDANMPHVTTTWGSDVWPLNAFNAGSFGQGYAYNDVTYSKMGVYLHKSAVTLVGRARDVPSFPGEVENRVLPNGMPIQFRLHYNMERRRHQLVITSLLGMHVSDKKHNLSRAILVPEIN